MREVSRRSLVKPSAAARVVLSADGLLQDAFSRVRSERIEECLRRSGDVDFAALD